MSAIPSSTLGALPRTLFGYEILDLIGHGAGSDIYLANDPETSHVYALKHVTRSEDCKTHLLQQLTNEYNVGRQVKYPGLRKCFALKERRTLLRRCVEAALIMELVDGISLESHPPTDTIRIIDCFTQTAHALAAMHVMGYAHCDLKPNNILMNESGQVKVIDFGQACPLKTIKERVQGTPDYIAPEQVRCEPITARTDVFNFGATLYRVLTGKTIPTLYTVKRGENSLYSDDFIRPPTALNPNIPLPLSNLVMECIRSQPHARPSGMNELVYRLETVRHGLDQSPKIAVGE